MPEGDRFGGVRELIRSGLVDGVVPSLAVAVAQDGEIVWEEASGWANRESRTPATPHTMYSLASISKPITATGLMVLRDRGLLDLDRPINEYLGDAKVRARVGRAEDATVRRVANHTSGLPLHYQFFYEDEPYRRPAMDETIRRYANLVTPPGERYQYSNLGYGLLDYLISRLSGKSYINFMREEVFLPLGMTRASVDVAEGLEPFAAVRYGSDGVPYPFYDFDHPGGSAVYCSAHDLVRFGMFHLKSHLANQKAILKDETIDEMQVSTTALEGSQYGIGWSINEDDGGYRSVSHNGGMGGVNTALKLFPEQNLAIVALANACSDLPFRTADEIAGVLLPGYAGNRDEQRAAREKEAQGEKTPAPIPRGLAGDWDGAIETYRGPVKLRLWILKSGDVHVQLGTQLKTLLNEPRFDDGGLEGTFAGDLGTEDVNRRPYRLHLSLKRRGKVLSGATVASTHFEQSQGGAPGRRIGNAVAHWVEMGKT